MKYDDLSFTVKYENGKELINDITAIIPNKDNDDEPYVTYTDYTLDENDEFNTYYGKIINKNGESTIENNLSIGEIAYIKESLQDEIVKYVNDTIMDNIDE